MALDSTDIREHQGELEALVGDILAEAGRQGASAAEVSASQDAGLGVTVRKGDLEKVEYNQDRGFGITVYAGMSKGSASTSDSRAVAIRETVARAMDIARHTRDDPCNGLAEANLMPGAVPNLDLFHPAPLDPRLAEEMARACEASGLGFDSRIVNSDGAEVTVLQSCRVYGNSHGFVGSHPATRYGVSCVLIAEDANGMQRDYWYSTARDRAVLESPERVGRRAAERTVARLSPGRVPTGSYPVLFAAPVAATLAGHLIGAISGGALYRKASFLLDSLGNQVASDHVSLAEQPLLPGGIGSVGFDADGVATRDQAFVDAGVVQGYALSTYSARRLGMATTGNAGGVHNLTLSGRTLPFDELVREMGGGLYVTELMGQGVDPVSGDYSRGASGFRVEHGRIGGPVHELTVAANLKDVYRNVVAVGDDLDVRGNVRAPSVLIESMTVAGDS